MKKLLIIKIYVIILISFQSTLAQTPYEKYEEFLRELDESENVRVEVIGETYEGRNLYLVMISKDIDYDFKAARKKPSILIRAGIHGPEISGYEAMITYLPELSRKPFKNLTILVVPAANPDGIVSESRYNALGIDLNRDHINLLQSETIAFQNIFNLWRPLILLDLHEHSPESNDLVYDYADFEFVNPDIVEEEKYIIEIVSKVMDKKGFSFDQIVLSGTFVPRMKDSMAHEYYGSRNTISILFETRYENPLERREKAVILGVRSVLDYASKNLEKLERVIQKARRDCRELETYWGVVFEEKETRDFLRLHGLQVYTSRVGFSTSEREFLKGSFLSPTSQDGCPILLHLIDESKRNFYILQDLFEIQEVRESSRIGDEYLKVAREEFFRENYEKAMENLESSKNSYLKAKKIFSGIEILELEEIEEFIQKSKRGLEAELAFKDGESFLESGDYASSKESFLKALKIFDELSNEEMVLKVRERLEEIEDRVEREKEPIKQKAPDKTPEEEVGIEILLILTSLLLCVFLKKIREKPQPLYTVDEI